MLKKKLLSLGVLAVVTAGALGYGYKKITDLASYPLIVHADQFFIVEKGSSSQKLAKQLEEQSIVEHADVALLPYLIRLHPELSHFKAGVYSLNGLKTVEDLLKHLNSGKEVQLNVKFIEGNTFKTFREQLEKASYLAQTLTGKSEAEIAKMFGLSSEKLEGWISPDTYNYVPYSTDFELLKRAYQKQQKALDDAWQNRVENLPLANPYEMLIVLVNRLKQGWKLETDPTVIYGLGERYNGKIYKKDLQEATPYNTYVIDGLPPTPIAMPSEAALTAVSQPDSTPYFFFVADGTGGHKFSRSLNEHNQAVKEWRKIERERKQTTEGTK